MGHCTCEYQPRNGDESCGISITYALAYILALVLYSILTANYRSTAVMQSRQKPGLVVGARMYGRTLYSLGQVLILPTTYRF